MKDLPINFDQPIWLLIPIILLSVAISAFLYYRKSSKSFTFGMRLTLFIIRSFVLFILGLLLLNPYFVKKTKILEKPKIVIAVDASESMLQGQDSAIIANSINASIQSLKGNLEENFDIDVLTFDHKTYEKDIPSLTGKRTDIGQIFNYIQDKYYMLNLSAVVLMSDGQNNQGLNPEFTLDNQLFEIYPIIYGDTTPSADISISKLFYNKVVRQKAKFPIEVIVQAKNFKDEKIIVQIEQRGKVISSKELLVTKDNFTKEIAFELESKATGLQAYKVNVLSSKEESNVKNNSSKFYIQMVESGSKILLLGNAPHPDLGAIASALRASEGYEVSIKTLNDYPFKLDDYQLVILHGLPSLDERSNRLFNDELLNTKAIWYIMATSTNLTKLSSTLATWTINGTQGVFEYANNAYDKNFTNFKWPAKHLNALESFPPLYSSFANFQSEQKSNVMLWQSIRGFQTEKPLLAFWEKEGRKHALLSGEGLWKWRIHNFQSASNQDVFNEFVNRVSKYLLTGVYGDYFNINYKNVYHETEFIEWDAQVYNRAFEPINDALVSIEIKDEDGNIYPHQFTELDNIYSLNLDYFKPGEYSFAAEAQTADTVYKEKGHFVVNAWNMEQSSLGANKDLLSKIAEKSNGKTYMPSEIENLYTLINNRPDFKPKSSFSKLLINLIDIKWLAIVLVLLLGLEWVLRKRSGSY